MPFPTRAVRWAAALPPVLVPSWMLLASGVSLRELVTYAVYLLLGVVGPGLLVSRAVLGRSPLLVADLAIGATTGMVLQLGAWFVAVSAQAGDRLRWWPVLVYATFGAIPALRRHWRLRQDAEHLSAPVAWVLSLSLTAITAWWTGLLAWTQPVSGTHQWPSDLYWHLGLTELFSRQTRPEDSQVAGQFLGYHWFSNADMAAASLMTGIDAATVVSRLWVVPLAAITLGLIVAVLREVSPRGQVMAAVSAVLLAAPAGIEVVPWLNIPWDPTFAPFSPSQNYSYGLLALTVLLIARYLRRGSAWLLLPLTVVLLLSPGIKATHLPLILSGLLLALAVAVILRAPWQRTGVLAGLTMVSLVVGTLAIGAGGAAGSTVQIVSSLRRNPVYFEFVGLTAAEGALPGGLLPPGLGTLGAPAVIALLFLATVLKYLWVAPGLAVLRVSRAGVDVVAWFLFGGGLAGWMLMLLVDQSGMSQVFFLSSGSVLWFVLAGWGLVVLTERALALLGPGMLGTTLAVGSAAGLLVVATLRRLTPSRPPLDETLGGLAVAILPAVVIVVVAAAVVTLHARRSRTDLSVTVGLGLCVGLVVAALVSNAVLSLVPGPPREVSRYAVSAAEAEAARWIADRAGPHDVVATNVHCLGVGTPQGCDARAFWVSALSARRTFIGGWGYLDQTRAMTGRDGLLSHRQPFYDQEAYRLSASLFAEPSQQVADELARRGVDWVYADRRRGSVSDQLADVAELVHTTADVQVYRLRSPTT